MKPLDRLPLVVGSLGGEPVQPGTQLVALGTQKGGEDLAADQVGLFMFEGKVSAGGRVLTLEVPSFSSWIGGDVPSSTVTASTASRSASE